MPFPASDDPDRAGLCAERTDASTRVPTMFVFKAAVVGAGVMGGEIAQVIASADIPVVLKDVDQKFVDAGLKKAREVTEGQVARLAKKGKISEADATAQVERT